MNCSIEEARVVTMVVDGWWVNLRRDNVWGRVVGWLLGGDLRGAVSKVWLPKAYSGVGERYVFVCM